MRLIPQLVEPRVLLDGLAIARSPRWHDCRLWLCNWGAGETVPVGLDGSSEVVAAGQTFWAGALGGYRTGGCSSPREAGPRGTRRLARVARRSRSHLAPYGWNEITVDGCGNVHVNAINFDFADFDGVLTTDKTPGKIALATHDGEVREVASELAVPKRDGRNARQHDADRRELVRATTHRLRHGLRRRP